MNQKNQNDPGAPREQARREGEIIFYTTPEGQARVEVLLEDETFWLSQKRMAELFAVDVRTVNEHLLNIFQSKELEATATIRKFRIVQIEGARSVEREIDFYNLDAIIAVGYRAVQFRHGGHSRTFKHSRETNYRTSP